MSRITFNENMLISELKEYISKTAYIVFKAFEPDEYWGTIDSQPSRIEEIIIDGINIGYTGDITIVSTTKSYVRCLYDPNIFYIYLDEEEAKQKLIELQTRD